MGGAVVVYAHSGREFISYQESGDVYALYEFNATTKEFDRIDDMPVDSNSLQGAFVYNGDLYIHHDGDIYVHTTLSFEDDVSGIIYGISLDIDRENDGSKLWVSTFEDGTLYARQFDAATLTAIGKTSLGAATLANVQNRTNTAVMSAGSDTEAWAYGKMVNPAGITGTYHLITTSTGVTGSWSSIVNPVFQSNDVLKSFHTTPELNGAGDRLFTGVRYWGSGSASYLYRGTNQLDYVNAIPFAGGGHSVKHGGMDVSPLYHIAVGIDILGTGDNRVLGTIPPYTSWTDITNNYPSGTVEVLRFL